MFDRLQTWFGNGWLGIAELLMTALCVFFSLSVHEFAHGLAAYKLGDNTAKAMGRLNLSPMSHLDPIGAVCLFLFGFGWAKPVPINIGNFAPSKRKSGMVITSLAGPLSNLLVAFVAYLLTSIIYAIPGVLALTGIGGMVVSVLVLVLYILVYMNISLAVFNFLPVPPLDGSKILSAVLPTRLYFKLMEYERYGFILLIILINTPIFDSLLNMITSGLLTVFSAVVGLIPFL